MIVAGDLQVKVTCDSHSRFTCDRHSSLVIVAGVFQMDTRLSKISFQADGGTNCVKQKCNFQ